jgi:isopentenyl-diphosphate delta-isomerase
VEAVRWVEPGELTAMMADPGLLWSPWFRILASRPDLLPAWWADLEGALAARPGLADRAAIHRVL